MSKQDEGVHTHYERQKLAELLRETDELPASYGRTAVTLAPVEPYLVHVFWEVAPKDLEKVASRFDLKNEHLQSVVRFYDITYIDFDGTNAHSNFDVEIDLRTGNWYIHLWSPEKTYVADLGLRASDGEFVQLARSNVAYVPSAWPHPATEDHCEQAGTEIQSPTGQPEIVPADMSGGGTGKMVETEPERPTHSDQSSEPGGEDVQVPTPEGGTESVDMSQPLDSAVLLGREDSELYDQLMKGKLPANPEAHAAPERLQRQVDLTEMSERSFSEGISSLALLHRKGGSGGSR